jgi:hypothetical protein
VADREIQVVKRVLEALGRIVAQWGAEMPARSARFAIVTLALLAGDFATTLRAQQQPATLTLACKGTVTTSTVPNPRPYSVGIIINFTNRTVQGLASYPVTITADNAAMATFSGQDKDENAAYSIGGSIDRVTGDLEATERAYNEHKILFVQSYSLQCKPTQRMF